MKHLIIGIVVLWAFFQLSSLIWSSKGQPPSPTFTRLLELPQHHSVGPDKNGYFYLLGFAADASLDPGKVGHEIWLETNATPSVSEFNYDKPGRSDLQIQVPIDQVLPAWDSENPLIEFRGTNAGSPCLSKTWGSGTEARPVSQRCSWLTACTSLTDSLVRPH